MSSLRPSSPDPSGPAGPLRISTQWLRPRLLTEGLPTDPWALAGFAATAAVVGFLTGVVAATFQLLLEDATHGREWLGRHTHGVWWGLPVAMVVCGAATATAAWLVHRIEPHAEGSGIPRVEAVVDGRTPPTRPRVLPVKYAGGLLSIGVAGLTLGPEGPLVQMGGSIAAIVGNAARRSATDVRILVAGGAAAGLATAFNAPIAGGVFILEQLLKRFDPRTTIATLVASASGFAGAHLVLGPRPPIFQVGQLAEPRLSYVPWVVAVGLLAGVFGVAYNRSILFGLHLVDTSRWPALVRSIAIGAVIGGIGWLAPTLIGGSEPLTERALLGRETLLVALGLFAIRFFLGVLSYAACTPGGLFGTMLLLGGQVGLVVAMVAHRMVGDSAPQTAGLVLVGMAALFTAVVRTPVTGLILVTELSASAVMLPPMLGACAVAMLVATALRTKPLYELLTLRSAAAAAENEAERGAEDEGMPTPRAARAQD